jgi:hypothetical protein
MISMNHRYIAVRTPAAGERPESRTRVVVGMLTGFARSGITISCGISAMYYYVGMILLYPMPVVSVHSSGKRWASCGLWTDVSRLNHVGYGLCM